MVPLHQLVAGALKNNGRALVIGRQTFGKGSVQVLHDFSEPGRSDEEAALKLTVAQYLTPGDVSIQEVGITPDVLLLPGRALKELVERDNALIVDRDPWWPPSLGPREAAFDVGGQEHDPRHCRRQFAARSKCGGHGPGALAQPSAIADCLVAAGRVDVDLIDQPLLDPGLDVQVNSSGGAQSSCHVPHARQVRLGAVHGHGYPRAVLGQCGMELAQELGQILAAQVCPRLFVKRLRADIHAVASRELGDDRRVEAELVFVALAQRLIVDLLAGQRVGDLLGPQVRLLNAGLLLGARLVIQEDVALDDLAGRQVPVIDALCHIVLIHRLAEVPQVVKREAEEHESGDDGADAEGVQVSQLAVQLPGVAIQHAGPNAIQLVLGSDINVYGMARSFQLVQVFPDLTVLENLLTHLRLERDVAELLDVLRRNLEWDRQPACECRYQ